MKKITRSVIGICSIFGVIGSGTLMSSCAPTPQPPEPSKYTASGMSFNFSAKNNKPIGPFSMTVNISDPSFTFLDYNFGIIIGRIDSGESVEHRSLIAPGTYTYNDASGVEDSITIPKPVFQSVTETSMRIVWTDIQIYDDGLDPLNAPIGGAIIGYPQNELKPGDRLWTVRMVVFSNNNENKSWTDEFSYVKQVRYGTEIQAEYRSNFDC